MSTCPSCDAEVLDIDVRCSACGTNLASTGAHRMVGASVLGQYEILEVLGQGGMSVVYRGRHTMTDQEVALKVLPPDLAAYSQVKSRFLEEARALAQLDHPNIVHLYNFGQEGGSFVLAMQFVRGHTWERQILEGGSQHWPIAVRIAIDVLRALEYAHNRGVIHRDMKPSNVLVRDDDGTATVMDFGIAKMTTSTRLTATGQTMGTVRYMSPEQVRGQEVDLRTDIYSLGATLYESLVGDTPFDGNTHFEIMTKHLNEPPKLPSQRGVDLPVALEAAVMRSLAKKPDDRFATARDFRKALEAVLKAADVGHAETLRMSRDNVAAARTASGGQARSAVTTPPPSLSSSPSSGPEAVTAPEPRAGGIADRLEPGTSMGLPRRGRGPLLWLGLGAMVAIAGAAVLFVTMRGGGGKGAAHPGSAAPPAAPGPFLPPDLTWAVTRPFPGQDLNVRCADKCDADHVAAVHGDALTRFRAFVAAHNPGAKVGPRPITVLIVPQQVLCDPRTYENHKVPDSCQTEGSYYRPIESTLLVASDPAHLKLNLARGLADAICVHQPIQGVCDDSSMLDAFAAEVGGKGSGSH